MIQSPEPGSFLLRWRGDVVHVKLVVEGARRGRAALRTNLGHAAIRREEIIDETEKGLTPLARAWSDIPLGETSPGVFEADIRLEEVGVFSGKACFFPEGSNVPEWPFGSNFHIKVESAETRANNSIYCVFPRQFGSFREVARRLDCIMGEMGFRIVQTLPPFPVPTTYAVMGEYGCPFAATDFLSVDPAMAEFDEFATPMSQFKELIGAVHARKGLFFIDLPANHTGWASTLQTHHPEWFCREADGRFHSPGAWGVKWADLVELDYSNAGLRSYMADVFLFWCRIGVDGFRCDAGYMIPAETWSYIVARVREEYPDTVFLLEGLGGEISVTDRLLAESGLDWAYSEMFQTYDREQFERYLPDAIARSEKFGTLVHFAETHDNNRLATGGEVYARLRVSLAALLSWQGSWGIANGVEWYCREKIDVHGRNDLNWGASENMVGLISKLNGLIAKCASFRGNASLSVVTRGDGNTLAVLRKAHGLPPSLVVANLDCKNGATVSWDANAFPPCEATDLLTGKKARYESEIALAPGEVRFLAPEGAETCVALDAASVNGDEQPLFHAVMPRDAMRDIVAPACSRLEVSADSDFRVRLIDPHDDRTLRVARSSGLKTILKVPEYEGDGSRCRMLWLDVSRYVAGRAARTRSRVFIPPPSKTARAKLSLSGSEVREDPCFRTVLANGSGAAAQVRVGWGRVESRYDALLAANTNPRAPSDRLVVWTRARCWLQREGYVRELDSKCITRFCADPAGRFAKWDFRVPCGMGHETAFTFVLSLAEGANAARLSVERTDSGACDVGDQVRLVFRPDFEWRSFHAVTKAYDGGVDSLFRDACRSVGEGGVDFTPYDGKLSLRAKGGVCHMEPLWTYNVAHLEDEARGFGGGGDLFSPCWISADLKVGGAMSMECSLDGAEMGGEVLPDAGLREDCGMEAALRRALDLYIAKRGDFKTAIAGYPWFLDWGRDTFIFMRGMIAAGMREDALRILKAFAAFEDRGTLPNIIFGDSAGNRDTSDAPLWFVRCVQELGEEAESLRPVCESIVDGYIAGTPNGIRVDGKSGLVWSPPHFTWMDTNYPACTPRTGYPIEIQALWISALRFLGRDELADRALGSVKRLFRKDGDSAGYCDCLDAPGGEAAEFAAKDGAVRPNQLLLVSLGVLADPSAVKAVEGLVVPGGIRSLEAGHGLYRGEYSGDENTSRKQAYHNGTVWTWQFPMFAEAMAELGLCTKETALDILASSVENLNSGCLCHVSEIADGDAPHAQKGCCAQAWGDSELLRVWLKLR